MSSLRKRPIQLRIRTATVVGIHFNYSAEIAAENASKHAAQNQKRIKQAEIATEIASLK